MPVTGNQSLPMGRHVTTVSLDGTRYSLLERFGQYRWVETDSGRAIPPQRWGISHLLWNEYMQKLAV